MEVDMDDDMEAGLLRQFSCLGTTDKDVLVKEMLNLVGPSLNELCARFYLEMTDWNLQAAICSYFDFQTSSKLPQMTFLKDITIGEGESVPPNTKFVKTWRIQNIGDDKWPDGCLLIFCRGHLLNAPYKVKVDSLGPKMSTDISVEMQSPLETGAYTSMWRMSTPQGTFFGDPIWVILEVDSGGTLALMQQMNNMSELGSTSQSVENHPAPINPFAPSTNILHADETQSSPFSNVQHSDSTDIQSSNNTAVPMSRIGSEQDNEGDTAMS